MFHYQVSIEHHNGTVFLYNMENRVRMQDIISRLQLLDEKIKYAERKYKSAMEDEQHPHTIKSLKLRIDSLYKERSLYHQPLQSYKDTVPYMSPLYKKIESILPYQPSRYL
jgi:hypothetical protein